MTKPILLCTTLAIAALLTAGCRQDAPAGSPSAEPATTEAPAADAEASSTPSEQVAYEPAYPAEVSAEGLGEQDVAQQEAGHSHDGEEHSHDDGDHSHEEDEADGDHEH